MTKVLKFLEKVFTPFILGLSFSLLFSALSWFYFVQIRDPQTQTSNVVMEAFLTLHNLSSDFRLRFRGPRSGTEDVVVLTVDNRAIEKYGRWPWPRNKIAKVIETALAGGAKTISFDIIFSEKQDALIESINQIEEDLKAKWPKNARSMTSTFESLKSANDFDKQLGSVIEDHNEQLILGAVYDEYDDDAFVPPPYTDYCIAALDKRRGFYDYWDKEEFLIGVTDTTELAFPEAWNERLIQHFRSLEHKHTAEWLKTTPSKIRSQMEASGLDINTNPLAATLTHELLFGDKEAYQAKLKEASDDFNKKKLSWESLSPLHTSNFSIDLENKIVSEQQNYCVQDFLTDSDPLLPEVKANWADYSSESDEATLSFEQVLTRLVNQTSLNPIKRAADWLFNIPEIQEATLHSGSFNAIQDRDGSIRRARLFVRSNNQFMPHLSLKTFLVSKNYNATANLVRQHGGDSGPKVVKDVLITNENGDTVLKIPVDERGQIPINYAGPKKMFAYLSAGELLDDDESMMVEQTVEKAPGVWAESDFSVNRQDFLKGKHLVFGTTAIGVYDLRVTPFEENFPGVETHANLLDNLLRQDFFKTSSVEEFVTPLGIAILGLLLSFLISRWGSVSGLLLSFFTLLMILIVDYHFFFLQGTLVNIIIPLLFIATLYTFLTFFKYLTEERKKRELKGTFQKYVSPAIVNEILKDPSKLKLGGVKQEMSVFFSDVRGFTTISERLDPRALSDLLNAYLTPMTELIFQCEGTLDKYMGDAIMGFFGAPIPAKNHAANACRSALLQMAKLKELQVEWAAEGLPLIDVGIGINTGDMSVGNMGSKTVRSYTVMGDAVNLGARLEGINKQYGTHIIISEFTQAHIESDDFVTREIDLVRVKGKNKPVRIFELIQQGPPQDLLAERLKSFRAGYELYHQRQFAEALEQFNASLSIDANDHVSALYLGRCKDYLKTPPNADWDGVFVMTTK